MESVGGRRPSSPVRMTDSRLREVAPIRVSLLLANSPQNGIIGVPPLYDNRGCRRPPGRVAPWQLAEAQGATVGGGLQRPIMERRTRAVMLVDVERGILIAEQEFLWRIREAGKLIWRAARRENGAKLPRLRCAWRFQAVLPPRCNF